MYKQSTKLEEQRKIALDEHLNFIVDQTEKMSTLVAESLMKSNNSSISTLQNSSMVISDGNFYLNTKVDWIFNILSFFLGKPNSNLKCPDHEVNENQSDDCVDNKKEFGLLKQESKLSIDHLPKGCSEPRANEIMKEVGGLQLYSFMQYQNCNVFYEYRKR